MIVISSIITIAVVGIIANAILMCLNERTSEEAKPQSQKPEDLVKRAYMNAYFAHKSLEND